MKSVAALCFLFSFVVVVFSQNYAQIGTFEGTYDDPNYGGHTFICQNGNVIQGSYSEVGIFNGLVGEDGTATGKFWQAGLSDCSMGNFSIRRTDYGINGTYTCNNSPGLFPWELIKYDVFRPTDDQCALIYDGDGSVQGHWKMGSHYTIDVCETDGNVNDTYTIHASYQTSNNGEHFPNAGLIHAYSVFNGKVFFGTWYEDLKGGAVLGYLNLKRELVLYFWTGLAGRQGASIIDASEYNVPDYHWITTYSSPVLTSYAQCDRNEFLEDYVNDALYYYEDGNIRYIYFAYDPSIKFNLDVGFDPIDYQDTNYYINAIISPNSSNYLTLSVFAVLVALALF